MRCRRARLIERREERADLLLLGGQGVLPSGQVADVGPERIGLVVQLPGGLWQARPAIGHRTGPHDTAGDAMEAVMAAWKLAPSPANPGVPHVPPR